MRVVTIVGTRPEVIRLSRVIARLDAAADHILVHTGQNHDYDLNGVFFDELGIRPPDRHLGVDTSSLGRVLGETLIGTEAVLEETRPDAVLVLGDTNSCLAAVMARRMQIPVYHMEAGNRCFDANVPEEVNRRLVDHVADFNLVYTEHARRNLLAEGIAPRRILLTGSPMPEVLRHHEAAIAASRATAALGLTPGEYFLVSAHRAENVDDPARLRGVLDVLAALYERWRLPIVVSAHPRTRNRLAAAGHRDLPGVVFHRPFGFLDYNRLQLDARCVLSDSGTVSEEAAILGFPAVTLRESIERPEALDTGAIVMSGLDPAATLDAVALATAAFAAGDRPPVPAEYQIGNCAQRVVHFIRSTVGVHHAWAGIRRAAPAAGSETGEAPACASA